MDMLIYVLHGAWQTQDMDGAGVLGVSDEIETLLEKLHGIAGMRAGGYVELRGHIREEHGERYYEAVDGDGRHAEFYNVEILLHVSGKALAGAILKRAAGKKMVCRRCGSKVRPERKPGLWEEYPYYCPRCDENMYSFECVEACIGDRWRRQCRKWARKIRERGKCHKNGQMESSLLWKQKTAGTEKMSRM